MKLPAIILASLVLLSCSQPRSLRQTAESAFDAIVSNNSNVYSDLLIQPRDYLEVISRMDLSDKDKSKMVSNASQHDALVNAVTDRLNLLSTLLDDPKGHDIEFLGIEYDLLYVGENTKYCEDLFVVFRENDLLKKMSIGSCAEVNSKWFLTGLPQKIIE